MRTGRPRIGRFVLEATLQNSFLPERGKDRMPPSKFDCCGYIDASRKNLGIEPAWTESRSRPELQKTSIASWICSRVRPHGSGNAGSISGSQALSDLSGRSSQFGFGPAISSWPAQAHEWLAAAFSSRIHTRNGMSIPGWHSTYTNSWWPDPLLDKVYHGASSHGADKSPARVGSRGFASIAGTAIID